MSRRILFLWKRFRQKNLFLPRIWDELGTTRSWEHSGWKHGVQRPGDQISYRLWLPQQAQQRATDCHSETAPLLPMLVLGSRWKDHFSKAILMILDASARHPHDRVHHILVPLLRSVLGLPCLYICALHLAITSNLAVLYLWSAFLIMYYYSKLSVNSKFLNCDFMALFPNQCWIRPTGPPTKSIITWLFPADNYFVSWLLKLVRSALMTWCSDDF